MGNTWLRRKIGASPIPFRPGRSLADAKRILLWDLPAGKPNAKLPVISPVEIAKLLPGRTLTLLTAELSAPQGEWEKLSLADPKWYDLWGRPRHELAAILDQKRWDLFLDLRPGDFWPKIFAAWMSGAPLRLVLANRDWYPYVNWRLDSSGPAGTEYGTRLASTLAQFAAP